MSVAFVVSDREESDPPWPVAAEGMWNDSGFVIQRNATAMPRGYVVPRATVLPDHRDVVLSSLAAIDPRSSVTMSVDPLAGMAPGPRQPFTAVGWTATDPDRPTLLVTTAAPGLLVVADSWMPGWTATVDGRPAPILRGNYAQRVIPLPEPGRHVIVMEYRPPGLILGGAISIVSGPGLGDPHLSGGRSNGSKPEQPSSTAARTWRLDPRWPGRLAARPSDEGHPVRIGRVASRFPGVITAWTRGAVDAVGRPARSGGASFDASALTACCRC